MIDDLPSLRSVTSEPPATFEYSIVNTRVLTVTPSGDGKSERGHVGGGPNFPFSTGFWRSSAIRRAKAYREAGADVAYIEALQSVEEVKRCVEEVGKPIMITLTAMWDRRAEEMPTHEQMEEMGLACAFYPGLAIDVTYRLTWEFLCDVRDRGVAALREWKGWENAFHWKYGPPPGFHDLAGFPQVREWEARYLSAEAMQKYLRSEGRYVPGES